jgi:hypothetical protein
MVTTFGFYLSGVIAVGIIFIGRRFLLTPSLAAAAYGGTRLAPSHIRKRISNAKGTAVRLRVIFRLKLDVSLWHLGCIAGERS